MTSPSRHVQQRFSVGPPFVDVGPGAEKNPHCLDLVPPDRGIEERIIVDISGINIRT